MFHHHHDDSGHEIRTDSARILRRLRSLKEFVMANLQQVLDDLDTIQTEFDALTAKRDKIDDDLKAEIAKLLAGNPAIQAQVDAAFAKAEALKEVLTMNTTLPSSFVDKADFVKQVDAYNGVEKVMLDGNVYAGGTDPALNYYTHSADGHIDTTGPSD